MKYIKKIENFENHFDKYWMTTLLSPYFEISLRKIGVPDDTIKDWRNMYVDDDTDVFICKHLERPFDRLRGEYDKKNDYIDWILYFLNNPDYGTFMGKIKVENFELDANKFNL